MHPMTHAYLVCALWASSDNTNDQGGEPLDAKYDITDIAPEALAQADADCQAFLAAHAADIGDAYEQAGHDFWLTRNHHGAGFWDGDWPKAAGWRLTAASHTYPEVDPYVGDDGKIYFG